MGDNKRANANDPAFLQAGEAAGRITGYLVQSC
jgi:hypothetical protein